MSYTACKKKKKQPNYFIAIKPKWQLTKNKKKIFLPIDNLGSIWKKSWQTDWWKIVCSPVKAFYHPNMYQSLSGKEPVKQDDHPNNTSCHSCSKLTGQTKTFKTINLWGFLKAQKVGRRHTVCLLHAWTEDWQHACVFSRIIWRHTWMPLATIQICLLNIILIIKTVWISVTFPADLGRKL